MENKGYVTIPTDDTFVEGTKKYIDLWGADAVRDCDGVALPKGAKDLFGCEVYKAYFIVREDHEYAEKHPEYLQNVALTTERKVARGETLEIDLLEGLFEEALRVNDEDGLPYWQVFDRTSGEEIHSWEYLGNNRVRIHGCAPYHEYVVNFFAKNTWDPVQIYNYHSNHWEGVPRDVDIDPIFPAALEHMLERMEKWCAENPDVTVVRFTTFFYNFFILYRNGLEQTHWDWHTYAMSASPKMFEAYEREYGETIALEDIVTGGSYASRYQIPSAKTKKYIDMVQRKCCAWAKRFVDIVHRHGKKAMMFDGDHRIGVEPYNPYFPTIGLDAVVGAPHSGPYIRLLSDMEGVDFVEGRLNPYFFPNECPSDELGCAYLKKNYLSERRALLKKRIDRIGFGGYLKLVDGYPRFQALAKQVCDEFRDIRAHVDKAGAASFVKIAVLSYWGKMSSWMFNGNFTDDVKPETQGLGTFFDAIAGQPVDVSFVSFDEVIEAKIRLEDYDVLVNTGLEGTSFQGDRYWVDPRLLAKIRAYVDMGGGFLGIGSPSGYYQDGRYFQLSDVLGVEKERGFTYCRNKPSPAETPAHWISEGIDFDRVAFCPRPEMVYSLGAEVLRCTLYQDDPTQNTNQGGNVLLSAHAYGRGRAVYLAPTLPSMAAFRLIYKCLLFAGHRESAFARAASSNPNVDGYYYASNGNYALLNNADSPQETTFYDIDGRPSSHLLAPYEIRWIDGK